MTSCHDVTKPDLPISACRCARKLILFLFPWFFRSLGSKMILVFHLCDAVTSVHAQLLIYLNENELLPSVQSAYRQFFQLKLPCSKLLPMY